MSENNFLDAFLGTPDFLYNKKYFVAVLETSTKSLRGIHVSEGIGCLVDLNDPTPSASVDAKLDPLEHMARNFFKQGKGGILVDVSDQNFTRLDVKRAFVTFSVISGIQKATEARPGDTRIILGCNIFTGGQDPPRLKIPLPFEEFIFKLSKCLENNVYGFCEIKEEPKKRIKVTNFMAQ